MAEMLASEFTAKVGSDGTLMFSPFFALLLAHMLCLLFCPSVCPTNHKVLFVYCKSLEIYYLTHLYFHKSQQPVL